MELENSKVIDKAASFWESKLIYESSVPLKGMALYIQSFYHTEFDVSTTCDAGLLEEPKKDFIDRIFTKSSSFWHSFFSPTKRSKEPSRKSSFNEVFKGEHLQQTLKPTNLFPEIPQQMELGNDENFLIDADSQPFLKNLLQIHHQSQNEDSGFYLDNIDQAEHPLQNQPQFDQRPSFNSTQSENRNDYQVSEYDNGKIKIKRNAKIQKQTKRRFSIEEDHIIMDIIKQHGRNFGLIAKKLPGRTESMIKNRYKSKIRKELKAQGLGNNMDTESDFKNISVPNGIAAQENHLLNLQQLIQTQFVELSSKMEQIEKLNKIKLLQSEIERIELMLRSTKCEIIKEYMNLKQE